MGRPRHFEREDTQHSHFPNPPVGETSIIPYSFQSVRSLKRFENLGISSTNGVPSFYGLRLAHGRKDYFAQL